MYIAGLSYTLSSLDYNSGSTFSILCEINHGGTAPCGHFGREDFLFIVKLLLLSYGHIGGSFAKYLQKNSLYAVSKFSWPSEQIITRNSNVKIIIWRTWIWKTKFKSSKLSPCLPCAPKHHARWQHVARLLLCPAMVFFWLFVWLCLFSCVAVAFWV